jgi:glycosyltransferase involved in cell wall biosynthesis
MRILHLDSGTEMRGGQWQVLRLMDGLRNAGHESVLLARAGSPLSAEAECRGIDVHAWSLRSIWKRSRAAGVMHDVTHAHDARSHTAALMAGVTRLVVSRRVAFPVQPNPVSRWKYRRGAHYIAVSRLVQQTLVDAGIAPSRIAVVYDGVPMQPPSHGSEILVPESPDPGKGTALALQAVKLAGFEARASRDLERDLAQAGLFLYITQSEGLGSAVLLAMAAGVPVIASDVGGLPEIVEHESTGLLTANTPDAIAGCVRRLMQDRVFAQSLAARARGLVEGKFSVEQMVAGTIAVYEALA